MEGTCAVCVGGQVRGCHYGAVILGPVHFHVKALRKADVNLLLEQKPDCGWVSAWSLGPANEFEAFWSWQVCFCVLAHKRHKCHSTTLFFVEEPPDLLPD